MTFFSTPPIRSGLRLVSFPGIWLALGALAALGAAGCRGKDQGVVIRRAHSINLAKPQKNWPGNPAKNLTLAQQEVFQVRGAPDFIRFHWKGPDDYATALEVPMRLSTEEFAKVGQSWLYLAQRDEVLFDSPVSPRSVPINDKLAVVILEGDPEDRKFLRTPLGQEEEVWRYFTSGNVYKFSDGKLIDKQRQHDPIPGYLKR